METATLTSKSYLTFQLGDELFAASVANVLEILELSKITKVPRSPDFMRGVINLRGQVLPVIDTRLKFGLDRTEDSINTCILVLNIESKAQHLIIGAIVDSVQEVMEIDSKSIQAVPSIGSKYKTEFIQGMVKMDDQFIMLLDTDLVFSSDEMSILQEVSEENSIQQ